MTRAGFAAVGVMVLLPLGACSNNGAKCSTPSSGTFSLQVSTPQPVAAALECEAGSGGATACSSEPPPFEAAGWSVAVDGSTATVTSSEDSGASWSCQVTPPSSPSCYLLVSCGPEPFGDSGPSDVQIQILATAPNDVLVLVHEVSGECCAFSYSGSWQE